MTITPSNGRGSCPCGDATFAVTGRPLARVYCHCLICQAFNDADRADVVVFRGSDVALDDESSTAFEVHRQPPLLRRGKCTSCGKPSVERLTIPGFPKLVIVPARNLAPEQLTLDPQRHVFYHRRVADADDGLPKHSGFPGSQLALSVALIKALARGEKGERASR